MNNNQQKFQQQMIIMVLWPQVFNIRCRFFNGVIPIIFNIGMYADLDEQWLETVMDTWAEMRSWWSSNLNVRHMVQSTTAGMLQCGMNPQQTEE